jgi:nicotinamide-nucleotide amidase
MKDLVSLFTEKKLTLSCAESLTGGLFASTITSIPGVSKIFKGGVVTYWNEAKANVISVSKDTIDEYGVVSSECASEMVRGVKKLFNTDVAISFTGNAGPTSMEGKPVGLVYIGIIVKETVFTFEYMFEGDRNQIREACVKQGIKKILELI